MSLALVVVVRSTFKHTLRDIHQNSLDRKFCFVLGAGASFKSGIPTGAHLADKWFEEITDRYTEKEIEKWIKEVQLNKDDLAAHYGSIYRKRFESDKTSGYEFLIQAMKDTQPTFGHIVLAQILTKSQGHCVLTTNFDSLIETAIYQFTDKTPLVCGHESLSGYARPSTIHPLIVKIHRDLLLAPKSDVDEINKLDKGWKEPLDHIFSSHIPIVIGYGGNDGSLMSYFEQMNKPSNFFWCELEGKKVSARVEQLIERTEGGLVEINGFDEIMHELLWVFDAIKPIRQELETITKIRIDNADKQEQSIKENSGDKETKRSATKRELSAYEYDELAENEPNYEKRKAIYLEALEQFPKTDWLWNNFTHFLNDLKKDFTDLDMYFQKALTVNPDHAVNNGNYGLFLEQIKKDYEQAEKYYLKSLQIEPDNANINNNYGSFLDQIKKDYEQAEKYYLKALQIEPENASINGNYGLFLHQIKKDYEQAEKYYLKTLQIEPDDATINNNYGLFLDEVKKDYKQAEKYYLKALQIEPDNATINGNYAQNLLFTERKEKASKFFAKAFRLNNDNRNRILLKLWFNYFAHYYEEHPEAETEIRQLLDEGVRALHWNLEDNVTKAIEDGHPEPKKLKALAKQITTEA